MREFVALVSRSRGTLLVQEHKSLTRNPQILKAAVEQIAEGGVDPGDPIPPAEFKAFREAEKIEAETERIRRELADDKLRKILGGGLGLLCTVSGLSDAIWNVLPYLSDAYTVQLIGVGVATVLGGALKIGRK